MQKTKLSIAILLAVLVTACGQKSNDLFNGKDLSNWNFVVENDALPGEQVYRVKEGESGRAHV